MQQIATLGLKHNEKWANKLDVVPAKVFSVFPGNRLNQHFQSVGGKQITTTTKKTVSKLALKASLILIGQPCTRRFWRTCHSPLWGPSRR